ncbi:hypothetical protein GCM10009549_06310 [Streptomyces thermoalcalitolerans]|uniref:Uncharacterized protein n=1 Tax=Streptomyces thermoalcalitolerans TaxID=65605 RepID=A0ABN1NDX8_9ACTN
MRTADEDGDKFDEMLLRDAFAGKDTWAHGTRGRPPSTARTAPRGPGRRCPGTEDSEAERRPPPRIDLGYSNISL